MIPSLRRFGVYVCRASNQHVAHTVRAYSARTKTEHVKVPIGGRGSITLDITKPSDEDVKNSKILISLPPGPLSSTKDAFSDSVFSTNSPSTTLIHLNYRLSNPFQKDPKEKFGYPQPIHDCSIVLSHILTDIIPNLFPHHHPREAWGSLGRPRIGLMGTHLGASLATMLALTNPNDIDAVAIADPMVDWVMLDEVISNSRQAGSSPSNLKGKRTGTPAMTADEDIVSAARHLINMRSKLFTTPSAYFDGFASPTLFLRAPGRDTPRTHAEAMGLLNAEDDTIQDDDVGNDGWEAIGGADAYSPTLQTSPLFVTETDQDTITEAIGTDSFGPYDDDIPPAPPQSSSPAPASTPSSIIEKANATSLTPPPSAASDTPSSPSPTSAVTVPTSSPSNTLALEASMASTNPPSSDVSPSPLAASSGIDVESPKTPTKRRKVLRRWPPNGPAETLLPYFNVYISPSPSTSSPSPPTPSPSSASPPASASASTSASASVSVSGIERGIHGITSLQARELVDLLRRACFYGREKGWGEERVNLIDLSQGHDAEGRKARDGRVQARDEDQAMMRRMVDWLEERL
jgi:hypothetical protein